MNSEEAIITPQERTGISLLRQFEPDIWVVVDGGHPAPLDLNGSGAGVIILRRFWDMENLPNHQFCVNWEHYSYPLENCDNSMNAEIWAAIKGLEILANLPEKKPIWLISDNSAVTTIQTKLLVIELGLKNAQRYAKELELSPAKELADLFLQTQPCQLISLQELKPEGFNLILIAAHQAAHELATKAGLTIRKYIDDVQRNDDE
ncbi:MAG TPA: hypothetical protein V6D28_11360 [Leptolyngbyaceae cyanobacterium]